MTYEEWGKTYLPTMPDKMSSHQVANLMYADWTADQKAWQRTVDNGEILLNREGARAEAAEKDAAYQRRHRKWALKKLRFWIRAIKNDTASWLSVRDDLRADRDRLREVLGDLISLASAAISGANDDGAEYDIDGELAEARAALEESAGKEEERG